MEDNLVFADFLALLDERERQVVVLLRSGYTKVGDVAGILGYKNHSPVSKQRRGSARPRHSSPLSLGTSLMRFGPPAP